MTGTVAHRPCVVAIPSLPPMAFLLRRLAGRDEAALDPERPGAATRLLAALLAGPKGGPVDLAALPVSVHDRLLAEVFRAEIGPEVTCRAGCTACGEGFEFVFGLGEVMAAQDAEAARVGPPEADGRWPVAGHRVRPPTLADGAEGAAPAVVAALCDAPPDAQAAPVIAGFLERAAPILALDLDAACPHCGAAQRLAFDLPRFLVRALDNDRPFLIRETHLIATRYGWSHAEIMDLPRDDRRAFATLIETERSAALRQRAVG
jgi:hypothetical protein